MKPRYVTPALIIAVALWTANANAGLALINNVPDWNQPYVYNAPGGPGPDPNLALSTDPYDNFCTPTAAANLFGYWEDVWGYTGIADRQAFAGSPAWPNNAIPPTWQQGLWHDATVELGWYLDTNDVNPLNGNDGHLGTKLNNIALGLASYAAAAWQDPNTLINKVGWPLQAWSVNVGNLQTTAWDDYVSDIDSARPVLVDFEYWNPVAGGPDSNYPQVDWFYQWGPHPGGSLGHTVTGVGYLDVDGNNATDGDKWWIVHDNWSTTPTTIAIPYWDVVGGSAYNWQQNDHVPEPSSFALLICAMAGMLVRPRRRTR